MQNVKEKWTKSCVLSFPKKGALRITKNVRGITLAAKVFITPLHNCIQPEIEKIPWKNQNGFG